MKNVSNNAPFVLDNKKPLELIARWGLFLCLFIYLLLRAAINEPLHDEIASYFMFFYHGNFISPTMVLDANNHLLNSLFGTVTERLFGENWFLFRLPNVLAFVLYFFSVVEILKKLQSPWLRWLGLAALTCPPYFLEYFAYARGYGLSMALLVFSLLHLFRFFENKHLSALRWSLAALLLAVSANLTLVNTCLIMGGLLFLFPLLVESARHLRKTIWIHLGAALLILLPMIAFGVVLKNAGALYYGGKEGLWAHTGYTFMKFLFFWSDHFAKYTLVFCLIVGLGYFVGRLVKNRWTFIFSPTGQLFALIYGNLLAIILLAQLFDVNYPEDRTVMYFIPFLMLLLVHLLGERPQVSKYIQWAFVFFPITLITHLSLHTSVFSPDDRMTNDFYQEVKKHIQPEHSISNYGIMSWNWPRHESHAQVKASTPNWINTNLPICDIILSKTTIINNPMISELYDTIAFDPPSTYVAFKRINPIDKDLIDSSSVVTADGPLEYANVWFYEFPDSLNGKPVQFSVAGHLKTSLKKHTLQLVVQAVDGQGNNIQRLYHPFEVTHQKTLVDDQFNHHFVLEPLPDSTKEIKIYFWNRWHGPFAISNTQAKLYELKNTGVGPQLKN